MLEEQKGVIEEESPVSDEQDIVSEEASGSAQEQVEEDVSESQEQGQAQQPGVDEYGVPWQNRAMEAQRKLRDLSENIPKIVEETLSRRNEKPQEKYTVAQLEAFAIQNPQDRPWVEDQKARLLKKEIEESFLARQEAERRQQQEIQVRLRSEHEVSNNPAYQSAFTVNANGQKSWNQTSPLTQRIAAYMEEPDLKNRPDALALAAKFAYADLAMQGQIQTTQKIQTLKKQNQKLKNQTMVEGAGVKTPVQQVDPFRAAQQRLSQTGSRRDAKDAVKEYLRKVGTIQ